jgi:hypothetical protein
VFSTDYPFLPSGPTCYIDGGLQTFDICYSNLNEIVIKLDSGYNTNAIQVVVKNIMNPSVALTAPFNIFTFYDGAIVDQADPTTGN